MPDATPRRPGRPKGTGRPRTPTDTRCQRLRNHLRAAGYPAVADYVEPQGDSVPAPFSDPDHGLFTFKMKPAMYGSPERILFACLGPRVVASEVDYKLRVDPDPDGARTIQISLRGMPKDVRASLVRAARHAGVTFPRYCISVLTAAASVADSRRAAGQALPERSNGQSASVRAAVIADPEIGRVSDGEIAGRHGCSTAYVQRIRAELGIPSSTAIKARGEQ